MKDATFFALKDNEDLNKYDLVLKGEFADVYELKQEYRSSLVASDVRLPQKKSYRASDELYLSSGKGSDDRYKQLSVAWVTSMFLMVTMTLLLSRVTRRSLTDTKPVLEGELTGNYGTKLIADRNLRRVN
jgi:hypothetical protein